jgi:hypothetical protein
LPIRNFAACAGSGSRADAGGSLELEGEYDLVERAGRLWDSWIERRAEILIHLMDLSTPESNV